MRKRYIYPALVFMLVTATAALAAGEETAPKAVVEEPNHIFAQVVDGEVVTHDFVIRNQGDAPLLIGRVSSD